MSALHFRADKGPVRIVFAHANGFNGQTYRAVLDALDVHSVAVDLRGHGMTDMPTDISSLKSFRREKWFYPAIVLALSVLFWPAGSSKTDWQVMLGLIQ